MLDKLYPLQKRAGIAFAVALFWLVVGVSSLRPMWILTKNGWIKIEYHPLVLWLSVIFAVISIGIAAYYGYRHTRIIDDAWDVVAKVNVLNQELAEPPWYATEEGVRERYPGLRKNES